MGMAASQARLLSITSRMSDNELRSQMINNAKMRLTTESSKASEEYIDALNKTQLMLKNYSLAGESQYQDLTFNSLTAYSSYNTQYGLRDKSGQLLVSELDGARYEGALKAAEADQSIEPGDTEGRNAKALEEFLKSYGLEKATTYFENPDVFTIDPNIQKMYEGDMLFDKDASRISGIHYGYELSKTSTEYGIYLELLNDYHSKSDQYTQATIKEMQKFVYESTAGGSLGNKTYKEMYDFMAQFDAEYETKEHEDGSETILQPGDAVDRASKLQEYMQTYYNQIKGSLKTTDANTFAEAMEKFLETGKPGSQQTEVIGDAYHRVPMGVIDAVNKQIIYDEAALAALDPASLDSNGLPPIDGTNPGKYTETITNADGTTETIVYQEVLKSTMTDVDYCESMLEMWKYFQSNIMTALDRSNFATTGSAQTAQTEYYAAAKKLSMFIFGQDVKPEFYDKLDDMEFCAGNQVYDEDTKLWGTIFPTTALDPSEGGVVVGNQSDWVDVPTYVNGQKVNIKYQPNFQAILDVYLCDKMMEKYGTPKYTWIDVNNPDENADAKAQWYTNLFERMQSDNGYKIIENGLASSTEWLKFALESSLISMEQVNKDNKWVSTMYSNCSDITESSVDVDITKAEAEYNKAMNKIETKDKRFDLELKNIDTEHQSLQTEYDSIKSVIDKNVERNFKIYSA